jgi:hypothetical protein
MHGSTIKIIKIAHCLKCNERVAKRQEGRYA